MAFDIAELDSISLQDDKLSSLSSYVMGYVNQWEQDRDDRYVRQWDEYYRMVQGKYTAQDQNATESRTKRAKCVMPAIQQAVETTVAEEEEALFGRPRWLVFQADDDEDDPNLLAEVNQRFLADCYEAQVQRDVTECLSYAAMYGPGIGKIVVESEVEYVPASLEGGVGSLVPKEVIRVKLMPVSPYEFVIDPSARGINEAHGMAQISYVPLNVVYAKQNQGIYDDSVDVLPSTPNEQPIEELTGAPSSSAEHQGGQLVKIVEYHGLVPAHLIPKSGAKEDDETKLLEVIVTIANDDTVLRVIRNPFPMQDRCFVAFQQDRKPGEFYGRGVVEKGYWPQKVLDGEHRARMEALSFSTHPMTLTNATMLPGRGARFEVASGKNIMVNGNPKDAMTAMKFPGPDPYTFQQAADMERMIEMSTGAIQAATSPGINARNNTATGISIMQGAQIKRSKRTLQNIERDFLRPMVRKMLLRYMQFDPERYPMMNIKFQVNSTMGIMAREVEQQQLTTLLQTSEPGTPAYWMLLSSIFENSSLQSREQMVQIIQQQLQASLQPKQPEPDARLIRAQNQAKEHEDKMALEYAKLESDDENKSRDRIAGAAKEMIK